MSPYSPLRWSALRNEIPIGVPSVFPSKTPVTPSTIMSFSDCVAAGYPVLGSSSRQCTTPEGIVYTEESAEKITYTNTSINNIVIDSPLPGAAVGKEFIVKGKARGPWFFEASFPIKLLDKNGTTLAVFVAQAKEDWMTENFVPFEVTIKVPQSYSGPLTLMLQKDNPSGLPENDASISFPLIQSAATTTNTGSGEGVPITLYYYNPARDQGPGGAQCSKQGLVAVARTIPRTMTPIQDSIKLLLQGKITETEKAQGLLSEFPLAGVILQSASLNTGVLTLTFNDPQNKTGGGACRVAILKSEIEATAKQFKEVTSVRFSPEELFQP